jgi:hypothetical protein
MTFDPQKLNVQLQQLRQAVETRQQSGANYESIIQQLEGLSSVLQDEMNALRGDYAIIGKIEQLRQAVQTNRDVPLVAEELLSLIDQRQRQMRLIHTARTAINNEMKQTSVDWNAYLRTLENFDRALETVPAGALHSQLKTERQSYQKYYESSQVIENALKQADDAERSTDASQLLEKLDLLWQAAQSSEFDLLSRYETPWQVAFDKSANVYNRLTNDRNKLLLSKYQAALKAYLKRENVDLKSWPVPGQRLGKGSVAGGGQGLNVPLMAGIGIAILIPFLLAFAALLSANNASNTAEGLKQTIVALAQIPQTEAPASTDIRATEETALMTDTTAESVALVTTDSSPEETQLATVETVEATPLVTQEIANTADPTLEAQPDAAALALTQTFEAQQTASAIALTQTFEAQQTASAIALTQTFQAQRTASAIALTQTFQAQQTASASALTQTFQAQQTANAVATLNAIPSLEVIAPLITGGGFLASYWTLADQKNQWLTCADTAWYAQTLECQQIAFKFTLSRFKEDETAMSSDEMSSDELKAITESLSTVEFVIVPESSLEPVLKTGADTPATDDDTFYTGKAQYQQGDTWHVYIDRIGLPAGTYGIAILRKKITPATVLKNLDNPVFIVLPATTDPYIQVERFKTDAITLQPDEITGKNHWLPAPIDPDPNAAAASEPSDSGALVGKQGLTFSLKAKFPVRITWTGDGPPRSLRVMNQTNDLELKQLGSVSLNDTAKPYSLIVKPQQLTSDISIRLLLDWDTVEESKTNGGVGQSLLKVETPIGAYWLLIGFTSQTDSNPSSTNIYVQNNNAETAFQFDDSSPELSKNFPYIYRGITNPSTTEGSVYIWVTANALVESPEGDWKWAEDLSASSYLTSYARMPVTTGENPAEGLHLLKAGNEGAKLLEGVKERTPIIIGDIAVIEPPIGPEVKQPTITKFYLVRVDVKVATR